MDTLQEFNEIIEDLLANPLVQNLSNMKQHTDDVNLLEHLTYTAFITYRVCKFFNLRTQETVRAALLHDFRLKEQSKIINTFAHSKKAAKEASLHFFLNDFQKNIILSHMWPLNPLLFPKSIEALIVDLADTFCATMEVLGLYGKTKRTKNLLTKRALAA